MAVRLRDRNKSPVGGFQFFQPETNFDLAKACPTCQWNFKQAVDTLRNHRLANPRFNLPTDWNAVAEELDVTNATRMLSIRGADSYIIIDAAPSSVTPKLRALRDNQRPGVAGGVSVAKRLLSGASAIIDWLGQGANPVPSEEASRRAEICAGCKWNNQGDWSSFFTRPVSEGIMRQLKVRSDIGLSTPNDKKLNVCEICSCPLKLKVHVPMETIREHVPKNVLEDLAQNASWCWMIAK